MSFKLQHFDSIRNDETIDTINVETQQFVPKEVHTKNNQS